MSESNERHCAGAVQSRGVGIWYVKQTCLETGPEDSHRSCGSDMFRQTVPDMSSGDRKSSVADGEQSGAAVSVCIDRVLCICSYDRIRSVEAAAVCQVHPKHSAAVLIIRA